MIHSNFLNFTKMQVSSLSQIVWLQMLGIVMYPLFFTQINAGNDLSNTVIFAAGLLMMSYLIIRNFAFNDAKYKTRLLFGILPVMPKTVIAARGMIVYLFAVIAALLLVLFSNITNFIEPKLFAVVPLHILPYGMLLFAVFLPIQFLIFHLFDTQKADIIAALTTFPYMGLMFLMYRYLKSGFLWIAVLAMAVFINVICAVISQKLYKSQS